MEIKLLDYKGNAYRIPIPKGVMRLTGEIISGDMVLNTPPLFFDTGAGSRCIDFYDGKWSVHVKDLERFNKIKRSKEALKFQL